MHNSRRFWPHLFPVPPGAETHVVCLWPPAPQATARESHEDCAVAQPWEDPAPGAAVGSQCPESVKSLVTLTAHSLGHSWLSAPTLSLIFLLLLLSSWDYPCSAQPPLLTLKPSLDCPANTCGPARPPRQQQRTQKSERHPLPGSVRSQFPQVTRRASCHWALIQDSFPP